MSLAQEASSHKENAPALKRASAFCHNVNCADNDLSLPRSSQWYCDVCTRLPESPIFLTVAELESKTVTNAYIRYIETLETIPPLGVSIAEAIFTECVRCNFPHLLKPSAEKSIDSAELGLLNNTAFPMDIDDKRFLCFHCFTAWEEEDDDDDDDNDDDKEQEETEELLTQEETDTDTDDGFVVYSVVPMRKKARLN